MLAVAVALSLVWLVVVLPGVAEAQYIDQYTDVASGEADQNAIMNIDSATSEPRPTHELDPNQDRMGNNPNLVVPGEKLLLPSVSEPATNTPANAPASAAPAAVSDTSEPVEPAVGVSSVESETSWLNERRLIGLGILVLTLALAILILWKMPMRRDLGSRKDKTWAAANPVEVGHENPLEDRGRYLQPALFEVPEEQRVMYINQIIDVTGATAPFPPAPTSFEPSQIPEMTRIGSQEEETQRRLDVFRQRIEELRRRYGQKKELRPRSHRTGADS
jgi:hypothetical protein